MSLLQNGWRGKDVAAAASEASPCERAVGVGRLACDAVVHAREAGRGVRPLGSRYMGGPVRKGELETSNHSVCLM